MSATEPLRDYAKAYGVADAVARVALMEAVDSPLTAARIAEFRTLLDEARESIS